MLYRKHKEVIMKQIEKSTGKRVFYVDAVLGTGTQMAGVFAGYSPEINEPTWALAEKLYHRGGASGGRFHPRGSQDRSVR